MNTNQNNKKIARLAGLIYLVVVLTGMFSLAYVPAELIDWNNSAITLKNIINRELLFRLGILSSIVCYIAFLLLPLVLYRLLKSIQPYYAKLMVILAVISVPISFVNLLNKLTVLSLINSSNYLNAFSNEQLHEQVMLALNQYDNGILIVQIFWGLWLFPFGYLVYKSRFLPKILGVFLMLGCIGYLINFLGFFLFPKYPEMGISSYVRMPAAIGEIGSCLWLIIMGAKNEVYNLIDKK